MQLVPVSVLIKKTMPKEKKTSNSPIMAKVKVERAEATFLLSPPEVINLIPATMIKIKATTPARPSAKLITFSKRTKMQLMVGILNEPSTQLFQFIFKS